jgi:metallo-beta-lactamase family protein
MLSAHADCDELLRWARGFKTAPRTAFIVHGEPGGSDALRLKLKEQLQWDCIVPDHLMQVELS